MRRLARTLLYSGVVVAVFGLGKLHAVRHGYDYTGGGRAAWTVAYVLFLCVAAYGAGFPDLVRRGRAMPASALLAATAAALAISVLQLAVAQPLLPRFVIFGSALVLVPWFVACAAISMGGRARAEERDRVVLVGDHEEADSLRRELERSAEKPAQLVAVLDVDEAHSDVPSRKPVVERLLESRATVVVLTRAAQGDESIVAQAAAVHEAGVRVRTLSLFYEEWLGKLPIAELERVSLMFDIGELHRARYVRVKRLLDVIIGGAGAAVTVVVLPLVALGDALANRGPLFFRQIRMGRNGSTFSMTKFRTMRAADDEAGEWTSEDDPRITPFGRFLRRSHIDELPQSFNILRGDLSVVGPRPEQPRYVAELSAKLPFYGLRHLIRPGLTGWAQVKYGYASTEEDALEKLQYEFFYLRRQGWLLDLRIIGRTIRTVLGFGGR